jgi:hypothetical protein
MKKVFSNRRGFLALLALLIFVAAALGGAIPFIYHDLPYPAKANRQELFRWLIAKDLAQESSSTRLALAQRLESEFASGLDWNSVEAKIDDSQRTLLLKNIPCVLRPWILEKAAAYERLSEDRRRGVLDRLLDTLEVWQGVEKLLPRPTSNAPETAKPSSLTAILLQEMENLQKEVPVAQRKQVDRLWVAMQTRWILRSLAPKS